MKTPIGSTAPGPSVERNSSTNSQKVVQRPDGQSDLKSPGGIAVRSGQRIPKELAPQVEGVPLLVEEGKLEESEGELVAEPRRETHGVRSSREFEHGD